MVGLGSRGFCVILIYLWMLIPVDLEFIPDLVVFRSIVFRQLYGIFHIRNVYMRKTHHLYVYIRIHLDMHVYMGIFLDMPNYIPNYNMYEDVWIRK